VPRESANPPCGGGWPAQFQPEGPDWTNPNPVFARYLTMRGTAMLGRKNYTQEEIDQGRVALEQQLAAYEKLVKAVANAPADEKVSSALESFEAQFFSNMTLVLDRYFVHRLSGANYEGKDGNPLNEVRILCDSLMNNNGVLRGDNRSS
jgi:hypothetical protein